jgi:hypothetical protein
MLIESLDDEAVPFLPGEGVEHHVGAVQFVIDIDLGDGHELESLIADANKLIGDDFLEGLTDPSRSRVAVTPR